VANSAMLSGYDVSWWPAVRSKDLSALQHPRHCCITMPEDKNLHPTLHMPCPTVSASSSAYLGRGRSCGRVPHCSIEHQHCHDRHPAQYK
jgi:hypothetical protein